MLDALIDGFDPDAVRGFLRSKFPSFSESRRALKVGQTFLSAKEDDTQTGMSAAPCGNAEQLGVVKSLAGPNGMNMPLVVVVAALPGGEPLRERSSRVRQFNFARKVIGQALAAPSPGVAGLVTQGLFVFHDANGNFRLSLVYGKAEGTKLVWSTVKRLSFYVEAGAGNKTFRDRARLDWSTFDKLKDAFSVEKLTKEFYAKLFDWYQWALSDEMNVTYPNNTDTAADEREINEHIIRLITRLMFVWFLKQKHLVPDNLFDPAALKTVLKNFDPLKGDNYYRAILQNLFFATLNSQIGERVFAVDAGNIAENKEHFDIKTLYRYGAEFAVPQDKVLKLFEMIPFLNGGLFECRDRGNNYSDGFSRNPKKQAHLPNRLFFDSAKGLIPLLSQYHFTVEENSPGDEEVALDPELLGKVFENLLGAYNPETKVAARNATGSFYTPREIVNYMVDESLKAHVLQKVRQTFLSAQGEAKQGDADIPVCASSALDTQTGMSASPFGFPLSISQRRLPHWQVDGAIYWVTFRLADSIPQETLRAWREERDAWMGQHPEPWTEAVWAEYDERFTQRMEQWLDAGMGSRALARPDVRDAVKACLLKFDGQRLRVHAAVIMPTHVHCLIEPLAQGDSDIPVCAVTKRQTRMSATPYSALSKLLQGIKGASARAANQILGTSGTFWMDESYDHILRNERQYRHFIRYIEENPTKAKLARREYWLYKGEADIPVCQSPSRGQTQTGMSASPSVSLETAVNTLFTDGTRPADEVLCRQIDEALVTAKILDPACGSGAFPMGILLRMVELLRILRKIGDDDHAAIYDLKLQLIENCIYGGDIQSIAVQITKLRFLISLVCEEKVTQTFLSANSTKEGRQECLPHLNNYGIHTLPNLETKFVAADSLIGLPRSGESLPMANVEKLKRDLWEVRHQHFLARTYQEKKELRKEDKKLRTELAKELERGGGFDTASAKLMAAWDPYDQNISATWSDPEWMFNVKNGFDIVIGNPPYVQIQKLPEPIKNSLATQHYATFAKTADVYCLFYERGGMLLGTAGALCYITSNKFFRSGYGRPLRKMLANDFVLHSLIDFGELPVFEAGTDPVIILFGRKGGGTFTAATIKQAADIPNLPQTIASSGFAMKPSELNENGWSLGGIDANAILEKMRATGKPLGEYVNGEIYYGIKTGFNEAFILTTVQRNALIAADPKSAEIIKPLAKGDDVRKWHVRNQGRWIIFTQQGIDIDAYPSVKKYLQQYRSRLEPGQPGGRKPGTYMWYEIQDKVAYSEEFLKPKIIYPVICKESRFALDRNGILSNDKTFIMSLSSIEYPMWVVGLLNSRITWLYLKSICSGFGDSDKGGRLELRSIYVSTIPIPPATPDQQSQIDSLVDRILTAKKADPAADTSSLEAEIDRLMYELYGLTEEEVAIVEGSSGPELLLDHRQQQHDPPRPAGAEGVECPASGLRRRGILQVLR